MNQGTLIEIRIGRSGAVAILLLLGLALAFLVLPGEAQAQKAQDTYRDKFHIADESDGVSVAASADGKHVYVVGPAGILASEDFGKTGTWVQTVRLK
jgi:photosystem II stability/assembly factor-like uncharacterized protein